MNENLFYTLRNIRKKEGGIYKVTEAGVSYEFDEEYYSQLRSHIEKNGGLIADWYRSLAKEKQELVKRSPLVAQ